MAHRARLYRSPSRTLIFELSIFEVLNSRRSLRLKANASENISQNEMFNSLDFVVSEEWFQLPIQKVDHCLAISTDYRIMLKIGEDGHEMEVDKLFAMQGKIDAPIFMKSAYSVHNIVQPVRCTVQVS